MSFLFVFVAIFGDGDEEPVDAELAVQLQRLLDGLLVVECHPHCTSQLLVLVASGSTDVTTPGFPPPRSGGYYIFSKHVPNT